MTAPPREPTKEMIEAGMRVWIHHGREIAAIYRAMHDAAPSAEPKCNYCDDTGCSMCDSEWAQHQKPSAEPPAPDARMGTHWETCSTDGGPRHWDCAQTLIRDQTAWIEHQARELAAAREDAANARKALAIFMDFAGRLRKMSDAELEAWRAAALDAAKGAK